MTSFVAAAGVEPDDIVMLVLSWHLNAAHMYEYSREEFEKGQSTCLGLALGSEGCEYYATRMVWHRFFKEGATFCVQTSTVGRGHSAVNLPLQV